MNRSARHRRDAAVNISEMAQITIHFSLATRSAVGVCVNGEITSTMSVTPAKRNMTKAICAIIAE
jgi:hypothetical protein